MADYGGLRMMGMHLAEFNFGTLKHDWDDPRVKDFVDGLDLVNGIAAKAPGFIWRLCDDEMDAAQNDPQGALGGNPRMASTLSVWQDVASLEQFVWNTIHRQYYARKAEWYDAAGNGNFVMWWVPVGHCPDVSEGQSRWQHREDHGDSDHAFGWSYVKEAQLWKTQSCSKMAAE
jgi:hypothetical protein